MLTKLKAQAEWQKKLKQDEEIAKEAKKKQDAIDVFVNAGKAAFQKMCDEKLDETEFEFNIPKYLFDEVFCSKHLALINTSDPDDKTGLIYQCTKIDVHYQGYTAVYTMKIRLMDKKEIQKEVAWSRKSWYEKFCWYVTSSIV